MSQTQSVASLGSSAPISPRPPAFPPEEEKSGKPDGIADLGEGTVAASTVGPAARPTLDACVVEGEKDIEKESLQRTR